MSVMGVGSLSSAPLRSLVHRRWLRTPWPATCTYYDFSHTLFNTVTGDFSIGSHPIPNYFGSGGAIIRCSDL